jgi:hypothetical protein
MRSRLKSLQTASPRLKVTGRDKVDRGKGDRGKKMANWTPGADGEGRRKERNGHELHMKKEREREGSGEQALIFLQVRTLF